MPSVSCYVSLSEALFPLFLLQYSIL
jgi:hypothetical protein